MRSDSRRPPAGIRRHFRTSLSFATTCPEYSPPIEKFQPHTAELRRRFGTRHKLLMAILGAELAHG